MLVHQRVISWIWLAGIMSILPRIKHCWDLCWGQPSQEVNSKFGELWSFLYSLIGGSLLGGLVECPSWWRCSLDQKRGVGMLSLDVSIWDKICGASKTNKCKGLSQNDAAWFVDGHPRCRINMNHIYVMSPNEVSCFFGFLFEQSILLSSCMFLCFCILLILLDIQWHLIWWDASNTSEPQGSPCRYQMKMMAMCLSLIASRTKKNGPETCISLQNISWNTLWWTNIAIENGHRNSGFSY